MSTRAAFLETIRSYLGTPWHHQGRMPGVGLDCPGPLICAAWALGLKPRSFDVNGYAREPDGLTLQRLCDEHLERIAYVESAPGDVLLCRFKGGHPRHLGILSALTDGRVYWIHADDKRDGERGGRVREARLEFSPRYMMLVQAYRVPGLDA